MGENPFALLGGDDEGDVSSFLATVANKAEEQQQQRRRNHQSPSYSKPSSPLGSVRAENGRGSGEGWGRSNWNGQEQFGNGHANGRQGYYRESAPYQRNNGGADGYRGSGRGSYDGYQHSYGTGNGYRKNYSRDDGNWQGRGRGRGGGRGRSYGQRRSLNEDNGFENESQGKQRLVSQEKGVGSGGNDGWVTVTGGRYVVAHISAAHNGSYYENGKVMDGSELKEANGVNEDHAVHDHDDSGNVAVTTTEVSKDAAQNLSGGKAQDEEAKEVRKKTQDEVEKEKEVRQKSQEEEEARKKREAKRKEQEEEAKKMTLQQYQKLLLEKKKALEALKTEERKVTLDKDFESMQQVGRKKNNSLFIKQDTEKDILKKKDDKVRKSMSINEFLKPTEGEIRRGGQGPGRGGYNPAEGEVRAVRRGGQAPGRGGYNPAEVEVKRGGQGRARGGYERGSSFRQSSDRAENGQQQATDRAANGDALQNKFVKQADGENYHVNNLNRRDGHGRRGSADEPTTEDAQPVKTVVKHPVPAIGDTSQFPDLGAAVKA